LHPIHFLWREVANNMNDPPALRPLVELSYVVDDRSDVNTDPAGMAITPAILEESKCPNAPPSFGLALDIDPSAHTD
jgi:hypothetical protein